MVNQSSEPKYKFTERSLEGTFIRCWSLIKNKWVNVNLKDCSDADFDRWIRAKFDHLGVILDESEYPNPTSERLCRWSIQERTSACRFLYDGGALVTLVDYLEVQK